MSRRRILLVSSVPLAAPWNGADKNLARLLATHDQNNAYIVQSDCFEPWPDDRIKVVRERMASPLPSNGQKLRSMAFMLKYTRQAHLIHIVASVRRPSPLVGPFLLFWKRLSGRPLIHTALSVGDEAVRAAHFPADVTVVITEHDRARLKGAGVGRVERLAPPLNWASLEPKTAPDEASARLRLGENAILYAGHYGPYGGVAECIEAFARLPGSLNGTVGTGTVGTGTVGTGAVLVLACRTFPDQDPEVEAERARGLAASLGVEERVRIVGEVDDMAALIKACAITVLLPTRMEGKMAIPQVLLESLALGRPIVTGSEPPLREALFGGGLAVKPGDIPGLADALSKLLQDAWLRKQLGKAGREKVRQQCSPEKAVQKYQRLYRRFTTYER